MLTVHGAVVVAPPRWPSKASSAAQARPALSTSVPTFAWRLQDASQNQSCRVTVRWRGELPPPGPGHSRVTPIIQFNLPETNWCEMHKPNSLSDGVLPYILTPVSFCERAFFRRGHTAQEDPGGWCTYVSSHDRVSRTAHYPHMILRVGGSIWFFSVRQVLCSFRPFS